MSDNPGLIVFQVSFDGEILMQGRKVSGRVPESDDDVQIVLLNEEVK
jgi:hypothetical protein